MQRRHAGDDPNELTRLIRRSRLLDPGLRQHWLRVLPYLTPADRARLRDILQAGSALDIPPTPSESGSDRAAGRAAPPRL